MLGSGFRMTVNLMTVKSTCCDWLERNSIDYCQGVQTVTLKLTPNPWHLSNDSEEISLFKTCQSHVFKFRIYCHPVNFEYWVAVNTKLTCCNFVFTANRLILNLQHNSSENDGILNNERYMRNQYHRCLLLVVPWN